MNWYEKFVKTALTPETMPYFQELQDEGQYVPDTNKVTQNLQQRYNAKVTSSLGCGDNGCAYLLSNGNTLKVTTNDQEGRMASWLKANPHPNVVKYYDAWKEGDLWYIVMETINTGNGNLASIKYMQQVLQAKNCHDPSCALQWLSRIRPVQYLPEVTSLLKHLTTYPGRKPFDILNSGNVGFSNGQLKIFDIT